jgi:hypothetical protein
MGALVISTVMDGVGTTLLGGGATDEIYPYPSENVSVPCWVVGFPEEEAELDETYRRGSDETVFPVYYLAGRVSDQTARDLCSAALTLAKACLDGNLGGACQTARLTSWAIRYIPIDGIDYVGIRFLLEVIS